MMATRHCRRVRTLTARVVVSGDLHTLAHTYLLLHDRFFKPTELLQLFALRSLDLIEQLRFFTFQCIDIALALPAFFINFFGLASVEDLLRLRPDEVTLNLHALLLALDYSIVDHLFSHVNHHGRPHLLLPFMFLLNSGVPRVTLVLLYEV